MKTGKVKLSHFSVKEYLMSTRVEKYFSIDKKTSHSMISKISIAYLLQFDDDSVPFPVQFMPLAWYAAEHWIDHTKSGGMDPIVFQLILLLFTSDSAPFKNWIRMYDNDKSLESRIFGSSTSLDFGSALYYSSLAGMQEVSDSLLQKGENANAKGGKFWNPLQVASYEGHDAIVELLLENGAEVNAVGGIYGNALQAASYRGNEAIVNRLSKVRSRSGPGTFCGPWTWTWCPDQDWTWTRVLQCTD